MKVLRFTRLALLLSVICLFLHPEKLAAAPGSVPPGACLYALDPTAANAFQIAGAQSVYTACGVVSESSSSSAFQMEGAETLYLQNHAQVSVVGGASLTGQTYLYDTISGKDVQAVQTTNPGDPLSTLSPPTSGTIVGKSHTNYDMNSKPANNTISPGIYCGGLTIGNTNGTTFTFSPGVYILAGGGLVLNSQAVVKGTSVTFYNTSSAGWGCSGTSNYMPITISGQVTATLSAPTSGSFDGILFFGNRTGCSTKGSCVDQINGGSTAILNGALYFASDEMEITASNATGYTMLVADKVYINGNSTFGIDGDPLDGITVAVSPATATLYTSQTQQFTATVTNTVNSVVNWSISPTGVGTVSSSGLYTAPANVSAQQTVTVTATSQADNSKSGAATITLAVTKTAPTITWPTPAAIIYGTSLSATQLDATANVAGTLAYTPAAGTVLTAGSQTLSVTFTPTNTTLYNSATDSVTLTVNKATPTITWAAPAAITYGTGLGAVQLDTTASVAGTLAYSQAAGTVLAAGNQTLTVTFTPTDTTDYTTATTSVTLTVNKATPIITWVVPAAITYGTALSAAQLDATSNVPGTFVYSPAAGVVLTAGSQALSVTFTPTDATDYNTATATVTLTVNQAIPTITWATPAAITYGTALSAAQLDATASVPGTFVYSPAAGVVLTAGSQALSVTFTPTDTTDYNTATATVTLTVNQAIPTITWATPAAITYGTALSAAQLDATASVPGTFLYSSAAGTVLTAGSQTLSVTFTPTDTTDYNTATATVTLTVNQAIPTITWATPAAITYGTALSATQLDATANVAGTFAYTPAAGTVPAAGSQTLTVTLTPTDTTDYSTATATVTLAVNNLTVSVTVTPLISSLSAGQTQQFTASVTNTSNTAVTWTINPAGTGSISTSGLYTAPSTISAQQTVTITATSQADTTQSASATVTLSPSTCASSGYNYTRAITIDHTRVANTDQTNFPFLFNTIDTLLATVANGGHVANANGYDIFFTSDAAGQNPLNYEMEEYNPATGQVIAWVQIPNLSHTTDTTIYMSYGNSSITASQQNPTAVWDPHYLAVWHVPNGTQLSLADSTSNGNNGTDNGAIATAGQIDGGMSTNGSTYATIGTPADLANLAEGNATFSAWVNPAANGGIVMAKDDSNISSGWTLGLTRRNFVDFSVIFNNSNFQLISQQPLPSGQWSYVVVTLAGTSTQSQGTIYINGVASGSGSGGIAQTADDSADVAYLANATFGDEASHPLNGMSDEFRISNTIRSADWIATEYANQGSPSTFYSLSGEGLAISPTSAILYESESQQFTATALNGCASSITWSISPAGAGSITQSGLYSAPSSITTQQTVTVTAANQSNSGASASATITLIPPVAVSVTPAMATLTNGSETEQFTATVANTGNGQVTWSISPSGTGSINQTGLYTAPASITSQQTVTVTATSQADATKSASATITLTAPTLPPPVCGSNGYSFVRAVVIDHTKVPNTDQTNFPFLFNTIDPLLATTANGGHITNENADDLIFTSDPAGQNLLNYEIEEYNPVTGQMIAWIGIPNLSHTTDTVIYMFYGNPGIAASQQNPNGVWDSNYLGVWHVPNGTRLSLADSTGNANNGTDNGAIATVGQIDGGMSTNGSTFATIGTTADLANLTQGNTTFSAWVNTAAQGNGGVIMGKEDPDESQAGWVIETVANSIYFEGIYSDQPLELGSNTTTGDNTWSYVVVTLAGTPTQGGQATVYINGVPSGTASGTGQAGDDSAQTAYLANVSWQLPLQGLSDEFRISKTIRSADWIAAEYANQGSPSTFYRLSQEGVVIDPVSATLYGGQVQQFTAQALNGCSYSVTWTLNPSGAGTITQNGLYTAPATIDTAQTVTVIATSQADSSKSASATIQLLPPVAVSVTPSSVAISNGSQQQQFTASVANAGDSAVTWSISPADAGTVDQTGLYTAPASITAQQTVTITATSQFDQSVSASATVTLSPASLPPPICTAAGYSFMRAIVIDHNQVPNTDQANFPFLFNSTDAAFATTENGGHMANINAYDLMFTTDPAGQNPLNYELEEYNSQTGQVIAWIRIPNLSHSTDTVIYMFYGNEAISASQQNPTGVWDQNFMGVWHVPNGTNLSLADSTSNGDNGTNAGATATVGVVDGGMATSGAFSSAALGTPANLANLAHGNATFSAWVNSTGTGGIILGKGNFSEGGWTLGLNNQNEPQLAVYDTNTDPFFATPPSSVSVSGGWNYVTATISQTSSNPIQSQVSLYVNGAPSGSGTITIDNPIDDTNDPAFLASDDGFGGFPTFTSGVNGSIVGAEDEFRISNIARSPDWIAAEYNNQRPSANFYALYPENIEAAVPAMATLYASQSEQFSVIAPCTAPAANWSMAAGSPGTLTTAGLYTAPSGISTAQAVTITATSQTDGSTLGTSVVTLTPPISVSVTPVTPTLYVPGESVQFTATVSNAVDGQVTWSLSTNSYGLLGTISASGLYTAPVFDVPQTVTVTATSVQDPTQSASATLSLIPVIVTPLYASIYGGFTQQFTANIPVVWSLGQGAIGSIDQNGLYTAPLNNNSQGQADVVVATAQADPSASATAQVGTLAPNIQPVSPSTISLSGGQSQTFNVCWPTSATNYACQNSNQTVATWSISPVGVGTISTSGVYTAPALIPTQQIVIVTAVDVGNPAYTSTAVITLTPPVISIAPQALTLYAEQKQQLNAVVTNSTNDSVMWSLSAGSPGTLSSSGLYTAPPSIATTQTVTLTATLQAIPSITASAVIRLSPAQCPASLYSYSRAIVIDHTQVLHTDQANFPFLFSTTDPLLATVANGGHLANPNGYDLIFTSDAAGKNQLPYEIEEYNPATGQLIAWIGVPNLSHSADTVVYMFYGNSNVTASQQNPPGVWGISYVGVWHLPNGTSLSASDSTVNGNNGTPGDGVGATPGFIDGGASFSGANTAYITLPSQSNAWNFANDVTVSAWIKTSGNGMVVLQLQPGTPLVYLEVGPTTVGGASNNAVAYFRADDGNLVIANGNTAVNDNNWHNIQAVRSTGNSVDIYVDGILDSTTPYTDAYPIDASGGGANIGGLGSSYDFIGSLDEVRVSDVARTSDWIATEYNNQSSPSTFSRLYSETYQGLVPAAATLYATQSEQFSITGTCNSSGAVWSMPAGSLGTLSPEGLYTAPETIDTQQSFTVTGTPLGSGGAQQTATITLMPPVSISVSPGVVSLPAAGTQQFAATVANATNTAVVWSISPAGVGAVSPSGLYTAPSTLSGQQTVSLIAVSRADSTQSASATITIGTAVSAIPAITVNPASADVYPGQAQQFSATVTNMSNTAVTWSINPEGAGSIDNSGLYTAPASITTEQTVTIVATSQADTTVAGSASVILIPSCTTNGYGFVRQISIHASQVPNSDQANFPFLFSTTDPLLATTANGGHVTNANGYDIIFTSDAAGQKPLNFEMEEYNPVTGQVVAWINIPNLSHSTNTVLYLFYGNPGITASQQNPTAVWDSNFVGVWHLPNGSALSANDSTVNGSSGTPGDGVSATPGFIDGGASFNGASSAYISIPSSSGTWNFANDVTVSAWIKTASNGVGVFEAQENNPLFYLEVGPSTAGGNANVTVAYFRTDNGSVLVANGNTPVNDNNWHYVEAVRSTGKSVSIYVDGMLDSTTPYDDAGPIDTSGGGVNIGGLGSSYDLVGSVDEVRVSNIARSADWIAAEYHNENSPSTFYTLSTETTDGILPDAVTLYPNQSQQFADAGLCSVNWSLSADAPGTLTSSGLYTAPSSIATDQTVTVTATSTATPGQSASATITLAPPISVAVSPTSVTLNANQTQQFTALVTNSSNSAVNWTLSPAGAGSIDQAGVYTAPASIPAQQTVTVTATSVTDPTKSASAMVTLATSICASTGYGYQRVIVIDHTKVAASDQINFPFLFNTTDPDLATVANGGHMVNPNGYDIIFSADPNGQTRLDFEVEQYNPVTGQVVAWIRIPTLSHSSDTIVYVFYGNPSIASSQANPSGVWDSNYQAVYHLGALPATGTTSDSTNYANNAAFTNFTASPGVIDGAASLDGVTSYLQIPSTAFPSYPTSATPSSIPTSASGSSTLFSATFGIWFKTTDWGGLLDQTSGEGCEDTFLCVLLLTPEQPGEVPYGSWAGLLDINFNGQLTSRGAATTQAYNDNNWHYAVVTYQDGVGSLYADGQPVGSGQAATYGFSPTYAYFVGTADVETDDSSLDSQPWKYLPGQIDEINVSSIARSGDWIETQYNNQSSPSTFYTFYSPSAIQVAPSSISLYASQSEQFAVPATCDATITWSLPAGSPGSLTSNGLYTAPSVVPAQQSVTVSAVSQSNGSSLGSAQVTLLPAPQPLTLVASSPSPYQVGATQSFTATLLDPENNPLDGVTVNFAVAGPNEIVGSATTNASGTASFTYTGSTSGTDTVQATASVDGSLITSNSLTAAWLTPPPAQAPSLTLLPQPSPGRGALIGAFTDNNGDIIEPIVVGTAARTFITPTGATRLQLGINSTYYAANGGPGFVVTVNGSRVTVSPTAMPWNWHTGGLNNNYQYGINDGSDPVVAAASLTAGQPVTIAYQSGTVSTNYPINPLVNANGESDFITGTQEFQGAYFPTLYTTGGSYPQNQPISVFAVAADSSGAPIANAQVTLTITGANPGQYQATSDETGTASFLYIGQYAGNDSLQAQATVTGQGTLNSTQTAINWISYPTPPSVGSLSLNLINNAGSAENFSAFAKDASGNVVTNVDVGFYVSGVDNFQTSTSTNNIGQAYFSYNHSQSGNYSVFAVDTVDRNVIVTSPYTGSWTVAPGSSSTTAGTITIGISANTTVTIPNALQLNGTVTDSSGQTPTLIWTEVSGPGTVTFANSNQPVTTATFSQVGTYVVQLAAADSVNSGWAQFTVTVNAPSVASQSQGWIGSPGYGSAVSGLVPITLAPGVTIASGTLSYVPTNNPNAVTVLNANVSGSGQIGAFDATSLANGSYWIEMQATDTNGNAAYSLVLVTVTGNFKPGRVTSTVTDLVVPSTGLPIQIQRTYDSLNASQSLDFGYGWSLGINVDLVVDPSGNVTFTLGGQRRTFYLTPQAPPCTIAGCLFPYYFVAFTPEPGLHGTLTDSSQGCPLDIVQPYGSLWECYGGTGQYTPPGYIYTDPTGTQYTIGAGGALQSIVDRSGNGLTITPNGITSTTGLNVPFVRDSQGRITQITDPSGNVYLYNYDANGNLSTVFYPNTPQPSTYTYAANHYYLSGTDFRSNPLPSVDYYAAGDTDAEGDSLAGKLKTVTDGLGETTSYAYDLSTDTTTVTYPPDAGGNIGHATMVYDALGDLLTSTDPLNLTTTNTYDANQDLLSTTDPLGHTTSYTYDANGNKTSQTYPATATSTNTTSTTNYNQYAEPTSTTDEDGNTRAFNYDASYNPASVTDGLGTLMSTQFNSNGTLAAGAIGYDITQSPSRASQFSYDANGDLISKTDALGRTTSYTYNSLGQKVTMIEPIPSGSNAAAATTSHTYDPFGNLTQTQAPLGRVTSSTYDGNSNKLSDTDARTNTTNYQYDNLNRLIETDYPDGTRATKTYDFRNNVVTETDQGGHVTLHQYDLSGRQVAVTQAYGTANATTISYTYDNAGRMTTETDALGHVTNDTYDAAGNRIGISGVGGNFTYTYDNARNRISQTDGNGNTTQYQYDARKRLTVTTYPDQTTTTNVYDGPGNVISTTDQVGNQVEYTYDAANQQSSTIQVDSPNSPANTTAFGYDVDGNVISSEDANSHTTTLGFDLLNEPIATTLPDGTLQESRFYDNNGNLSSVAHFNGVVTTYTYDQLNRLLSRATPGEATVSFTYTQTGQYATSTDQSGTTTYSYDSMDRITSKATPEGTLNYTYDAAGHVASIASGNTNGASMSYTYDDLNRLSTVTDGRTGGITNYIYDNANNVGTVTYSNGVKSTFTYDSLNRVASLSSQPASYTYQRGPTGNLTSTTESSGRQVNWSYDGIYRLMNETISLAPSHDNGSVSYGLDPVGNRQSEGSSLPDIPSGSWNFNADDEMSSEAYDQNGNVTAEGGKAFTYNSQNQMITMAASGTSASMMYDAFGNRVSKTVNGVTTRYLIEDDKNPTGLPQVFDELTNGAVSRTYAYGLQRISEYQPISNTWTASFYGYDGGGNVRQLTNSSGAVTDTYEYDAFGNSFTVSGSTPNNYLYRGEQFDPDLNLYYLRARYYNPLSGRFTGVDPLTDEGQRRYEFAAADPVDGADPSGTEDLEEYRPLFPESLPFVTVHFPTWCEFAQKMGLSKYFPSCNGPGNPPGRSPGAPPHPCPKCFAQLKYRTVNIASKTHAFWWIQDVWGQRFVIDGGPSNGDVPKLPGLWGYLTDWVTLGDVSQRYPADNAHTAGTCFDSGLSCSVCGQVTALEVAAEDWPKPNNISYYPWGPNSNSFARYVGEQGLFHPSPPPGSFGWSHSIP